MHDKIDALIFRTHADCATALREHDSDIFDAVSSADSDVESSVDSDVRSSAASEVESSADSDAESSADSEVSIVSKASATKSHNVEVVAQTTATCPIDDTVTKLMVQVDRLRDNISSLNAEKSTIVVELQQTAREHHIAQEELTSVRGKISALQEWCTSLESATSKLSEEQAALVTQKTVAESTVAHIREDLEQLEQQRSRMQDQLQTMTLEKTGVEEDRDAAKEAVAALEACKEEKRLELQEITGELSKCRMEMEVLHLERESVQTQLQRETDLLKMLQTTLVPAAKSIQQTMSVAPAATVAAPSANDSAVSLNSDIDDLEGKLHGRVEVLLKEITTLQSQKQVLLADIQALDRLPPVMKRMPRGGLSSSSAAAGKQRRSVSFSAPAVTSVLGESVFSSSSDEEARV